MSFKYNKNQGGTKWKVKILGRIGSSTIQADANVVPTT